MVQTARAVETQQEDIGAAWENTLSKTLFRLGTSTNELARHTGLDRATLWRVAAGAVCPSLETARRIAAALGMPIERVFYSHER